MSERMTAKDNLEGMWSWIIFRC